jgi:Prealbumin-like fold domain
MRFIAHSLRVRLSIVQRRHFVFGVTGAVAAGMLALFVASAFGLLEGSPSKFEAGDGNMTVGTTGDTDWNCFTNLTGITVGQSCGVSGHFNSGGAVSIEDPNAGTTKDLSWKSGQKQDTECPILLAGNNPGKDTFTNVASYNETNNEPSSNHKGQTYLYGATIRETANGNASENVELNHRAGTSKCSILRTVGDKLIAIDYLKGGTEVEFHVLTWITSTTGENSTAGGNAGTCFVSKDEPPCWGAKVKALSASAAEGKANQEEIPATSNGLNKKLLVAGKFAEFGINLAEAEIIPANTCEAFPQTVWESRSSGSSFESNPEDIEIEHHTINNCGEVEVTKTGSDGGAQTGAVFTLYSGSSTAGAVVGTCTVDATGTCLPAFTSLQPGEYTIDETKAPAGYAKDASLPKTFSVAAAETKNLSFTDPVLGKVKVTKKGADGGPQTGAVFTLYSGSSTSGAVIGTCTVDSTGTCLPSFTALQPGEYTIDETKTPIGYSKDTTLPLTFSLALSETKNLAFTDPPLPGGIKIIKAGKDKNCASASSTISNGVCTGAAAARLSGATFAITDSSGNQVTGSPATTGADGTVCVDNLPSGASYTVKETKAPSGYALDSSSGVSVTVSRDTPCSGGSEATQSFSDTPLTDLSTTASAEVAGTTNSTITCKNAAGETVGSASSSDPATATANGLKVGTYTCTVVVDP